MFFANPTHVDQALKAPHPSPLSAHRGFLGCGHFSATNAWLAQHGQAPIDWSLPPRAALEAAANAGTGTGGPLVDNAVSSV